MSSSNSRAPRPQGAHLAPRKGGRVLTGRNIRIEGTRRSELELHYLGRALLRLAQEHYDGRDNASQAEAHVSPHEADTAPNWAAPGSERTVGTKALPGGETGRTR